jgi:hypothetical protein
VYEKEFKSNFFKFNKWKHPITVINNKLFK